MVFVTLTQAFLPPVAHFIGRGGVVGTGVVLAKAKVLQSCTIPQCKASIPHIFTSPVRVENVKAVLVSHAFVNPWIDVPAFGDSHCLRQLRGIRRTEDQSDPCIAFEAE